jgi:hypothetical protein
MKKDTNNKILAIIYSDKNKFLLLKTNPKTMKINKWYVVTGSVKLTSIIYNYEWPKDSGIMKYEKVFLVKVKHTEPKITAWEHLDFKWLSKQEFIKKIYWFGEDKYQLKELLKNLE